MNVFPKAALFALFSFATLAGCGGGGGSAVVPIGRINGNYSAAYSSNEGAPFSGTGNLFVDDAGRVSGTVTDSRYGTGTVGANSRFQSFGRLVLYVAYGDGPASPTTITAGTLNRSTDGMLSGSLAEAQGTVSSNVGYTLTPVIETGGVS